MSQQEPKSPNQKRRPKQSDPHFVGFGEPNYCDLENALRNEKKSPMKKLFVIGISNGCLFLEIVFWRSVIIKSVWFGYYDAIEFIKVDMLYKQAYWLIYFPYAPA